MRVGLSAGAKSPIIVYAALQLRRSRTTLIFLPLLRQFIGCQLKIEAGAPLIGVDGRSIVS